MEIKLNSSKLNFTANPQKIIQNLLDFNLGSAVTEMIDINASIENKAFYLLYNVTQKTNHDLSKKLGQEELNKTQNLILSKYELESEWKNFFEQEITLTKDFFENVIQYNPAYLTSSFKLFEKYLKDLNIKYDENFCYEYYASFRDNLKYEFQEKKSKYNDLVDFFNNPIYVENEKIKNQLNHYVEIKSLFTANLQMEVKESKETLRDLYIEPYFEVYKNNLISEYSSEAYVNKDFITISKKTTIHSFLNNFFLNGVKYSTDFRDNYNMIFVLGQPGQGKTSFCYKLIYDILNSSTGLPSVPLFFIKIRDLHSKDFINDTFTTINNAISQNIDFNNDRCILILDGLDEAFMSGGLTDNDLKILYERLNKTSRQNKNLKIVLTSRLNYLNINDPSIDGSLVVKLNVLDNTQIKSYINKFSNFYPENVLVKKINKILKDESYKHIKELFEQPVLMYFIALSNINIEKNDSKALVYNKIFDSLAKRSWDKNGQLNHIKQELKDNHYKYSKLLRQYIRNIAFEIFQSANLHISIKKLNELDSTKLFISKCFNDSIENNSENIKEISKYLLISFYFQKSNKTQEDDTAIEFFHNSLWEFLTAEYLWEENKRILLNTDYDGELVSVNMEEYFNLLNTLSGNKEVSYEIAENLKNIILYETSELKEKCAQQSENLFYKLSEKEFLLNYDWKSCKLTAMDKSFNNFLLCWLFYYNSNLSLKKAIHTDFNINNLFFNYRSNLHYSESLENICFRGEFYSTLFLHDNLFKNVSFEFEFSDNLYLRNNIFFNSSFSIYFDGHLLDSELHNVCFDDVYFSENFKIERNNFDNCSFIDAKIQTHSWYQEFIKNNIFDEDFLKNHTLTEIQNEKGSNYKYSLNYTKQRQCS